MHVLPVLVKSERDTPAPWPLAISAPIWIGLSGLLWLGVVRGAGAILRSSAKRTA